jgi:glycosyltransferase involved in cell wall biosynthesis
MKITYIHQHFVTRQGSAGTRSYDVSAHMVSMGHQVTLICGLHDQSALPKMRWWQAYNVCHFEGFKVIVCNAPYSNKMSIPQRLWSVFGFAMLASWAAICERGSDLVFATSVPLEVSVPGFLASRLHRTPMVFEVRDLWPEDLVDAGRIKRGGIGHKLQSFLEWFAYRSAARVLLVSRGFHDRLLERGYPDSLLRTILLGGDGTLFKSVRPDPAYLEKLGLAGKCVAIYTGAHGIANGLMQLLDAAELLRDRPDIAIVCIGDGKQRAELIAEAKRRRLDSVHFPGSVPKTQLPGILAAAQIGLMILSQISRPRWVTPNKLFDYMFTGLPQIVNFAGTTAELVNAERVGLVATPGSTEDLAAKIRYYADHPDERRETGLRAREIAWSKYDRRSIARQLLEVFETVIAERKSRRSRTHPTC